MKLHAARAAAAPVRRYTIARALRLDQRSIPGIYCHFPYTNDDKQWWKTAFKLGQSEEGKE